MSDFISSEAETNIGHNPSRRLLGFISLEKRVFRMDFDICHLRNHKHLWDLNVVPSRFLFLALSLSLSISVCFYVPVGTVPFCIGMSQLFCMIGGCNATAS